MVVKDLREHDHSSAGANPQGREIDVLRKAIDHAAHLLPVQGPIGVFIHHNTLHAFEHLSFEEAVEQGARVFHCRPYLPEQKYREALARGHIRSADLQSVLEGDLGDRAAGLVPPHGTRFDLRLAMLQHATISGTADELRWFVEETDALRRFRPEVAASTRIHLIGETRHWVLRDLRGRNGSAPAWVGELLGRLGAAQIESWNESTWEEFTLGALWEICRAGVLSAPTPPSTVESAIRHRDLLLEATGIDTDRWVHDLLIRFSSAYVDQGVSHWPLPEREHGFFLSFCSLYRQAGGPPDPHLKGLDRELARLQDSNIDPVQCIHESMLELGVPASEWAEYLSATLLTLRGWGGIVRHLEEQPDRVAHPVAAESFAGFVAVRLLLERFTLTHAARESLKYTGSLAELRNHLRSTLLTSLIPKVEEQALRVFQLGQILEWTPEELCRLGPDQWAALLREIDEFSPVYRQRIFHRAYEQRFRDQCLNALTLHAPQTASAPSFQVVTFLDEREESFRRHLEEVAPDCETFGTAGFYGVAMYYKGASDAHFVPLCPVVIRPRHFVEERVDESLAEMDQQARRFRRTLGRSAHWVHRGTREFVLGAILTAGMGVLATVPLVGRVLLPGLAAHLRRRAGGLISTPKKTRLHLERNQPVPEPECAQVGFSLDEMTAIAERVLRDIGMTRRMSRLVVLLGHGSHSMNNPHESAHDCGACGGSVGGPNGRAIAQILNDRRVRAALCTRGLAIPEDTIFIGGLHNTCNEDVKLFDLDRVPESHCDLLGRLKDIFEETLDRNAHERARRFDSAPLTITPSEARKHMDARAEDLAQVRPEWGHATNALCIVGRRERTRGLFLDRRAFLTSYDPTQDDDDATILTRTLQAVFPVCAGINLEYYFSHIDNTGYGCGTKLPHNITSLIGVMDGAASDLRTGLPWQMVEIHEPVRLLIVCETTPTIMLGILRRNPALGNMAEKGWVQLAVLDPYSQAIQVFQNGEFHDFTPRLDRLPLASSSVDWYRGWRDYLEFAEIV
jgi:uncharacterized protein YbcC (UPF0753/DUF2309 family)